MGGTMDRSKKRIHLWKNAFLHFSLCFVVGFFIGFAPTTITTTHQKHPINHVNIIPKTAQNARTTAPAVSSNDSLTIQDLVIDFDDSAESNPRKLLIIITTTRTATRYKQPELLRFTHTLRLVKPPLLWLVVDAEAEAFETAALLRGTGVMYRHLTYKPENFTDSEAEAHHQRNVALAHVESHRLAGIVHFASAADVYDLQFFEEIRQIEVFGTWPVATVSASKKKVVVEGPLCSNSKVTGWFSQNLTDRTTRAVTYKNEVTDSSTRLLHTMDVSGLAFNSSVLWDPDRWGQPTSLPDTSQDSIRFVQDVVLEDKAKLKGLPSNCSQILMWHLLMPRTIPLLSKQNQSRR